MRDGRVRKLHFSLRVPTFGEMRAMLEAAGFTDVAGYGDDGGPLTGLEPPHRARHGLTSSRATEQGGQTLTIRGYR